MRYGDILAEIRRSLKEPSSGGHWTDADILRRANIGQRKVVRLTSCLEAVWTTTTVAGRYSYAKPLKCLRILRVSYKNAGQRLYPTSSADLDIYASTGQIGMPWTDLQGEPTNYWENLRYIFLYPKPNAAETLRIEGIVRPDDLVNPDSVPFNGDPLLEDYHDLIISYVLWRCLLEDGNALYEAHRRDFYEGIASINMDMKRKPDTLGTFDLVRPRRGVRRGPLPLD